MAPDEHLARFGLADLFLDTLPYNAHTTASDALWTGVPVVTCIGEAFAGRVAASLLKAAGLPELVTAIARATTGRWLSSLDATGTPLKRLKEKLTLARFTLPFV